MRNQAFYKTLQRLGDIIKGLDVKTIVGNKDICAAGISSDSRDAGDGCVFIALRGERYDGHHFVEDAVKRGAAAVVVERVLPALPVTQVVVPDTKSVAGIIADAFYGKPSRCLSIIGVTGTNGKTTTTYLIESILESAGIKTGVIGTISYRYSEKTLPADYTTPEAPGLHGLMRSMLDDGVTHCIMEVSSHALVKKRVDGCRFTGGVFTNLTRDHLDFHHTMDAYYSSKRRLFESLMDIDSWSVINIDDPWGSRLAASLSIPVVGYGFNAGTADIICKEMLYGENGTKAEINTPMGKMTISSPLIGIHNLKNIMAAVGVSVALGLDKSAIEEGIKRMNRVPGRMDVINLNGFNAVVDYAHTPDALECVLKSLRGIGKGRRIITVFGCGGERDRLKRPQMGSVAKEWSDFTILTSDNPRGEGPLDIIENIESGMMDMRRYEPGDTPSASGYMIVPERRDAIRTAVSMASAGDMILVAGKGHERYQIIGDERIPFDDMSELKIACKEKGKGK